MSLLCVTLVLLSSTTTAAHNDLGTLPTTIFYQNFEIDSRLCNTHSKPVENHISGISGRCPSALQLVIARQSKTREISSLRSLQLNARTHFSLWRFWYWLIRCFYQFRTIHSNLCMQLLLEWNIQFFFFLPFHLFTFWNERQSRVHFRVFSIFGTMIRRVYKPQFKVVILAVGEYEDFSMGSCGF